jgi:hypothetical protein
MLAGKMMGARHKAEAIKKKRDKKKALQVQTDKKRERKESKLESLSAGGVSSKLDKSQVSILKGSSSPRKSMTMMGKLHAMEDKVLVEREPKSIYLFAVDNLIRVGMIKLSEWKLFDYFIMTCILCNSITLACYDYNDRDVKTKRNQILEQLGSVFTIIFTLECLIKIVAMGFFKHKTAYLRDGWNTIDFVVVLTGMLELIPGSLNLKSLRTVRVLRPLRSINAFPRMKKLVMTLIKSLPEFLNVAAFLFFFFLLFSIMGLNTMQGLLYNRCRMTAGPKNATFWEIDETQSRLCSMHSLGRYQCKSGTYCGNPDQYKLSLSYDKVDENININYGLATFNDVASSFFTVFQVLTQDGWTTHLYNYLDSDIAIMAGLFFCMIILLGPFFLLNLILAVILASFHNITMADEIGGNDSSSMSEDSSC